LSLTPTAWRIWSSTWTPQPALPMPVSDPDLLAVNSLWRSREYIHTGLHPGSRSVWPSRTRRICSWRFGYHLQQCGSDDTCSRTRVPNATRPRSRRPGRTTLAAAEVVAQSSSWKSRGRSDASLALYAAFRCRVHRAGPAWRSYGSLAYQSGRSQVITMCGQRFFLGLAFWRSATTCTRPPGTAPPRSRLPNL